MSPGRRADLPLRGRAHDTVRGTRTIILVGFPRANYDIMSPSLMNRLGLLLYQG